MMTSVVVIALVIGSATTLIGDVQKERSEVTIKLQAIDRYACPTLNRRVNPAEPWDPPTPNRRVTPADVLR